MDDFARLVDVVTRLRATGGCAWDRAQTPESMVPHLLDEAREVADAVAAGDPDELAQELGDVLYNVVMIACMHDERGAFTAHDAARAAADKMVRRHPHVFGDATEPPDWRALKADEARRDRVLDTVPASLPPLDRAHRVTSRAAEVGFDWPDVGGVRAKVDEELAELDEAMAAGDADAVTEELGDLLFTLVNLSRFTGTPAADALAAATAKFERRFRAVEAAVLDAGGSVSSTGIDELERLWARAKEHTS